MKSNEFVKTIKTEEINFKYANGCRDILGKEIHTYHEIFYFVSGNAEFISSCGRKKIFPGTVVIIPKETFHQFHNNTTDYDYMRCVLNFDTVNELENIISAKMKEICVFKSKKADCIFNELISLTKSDFSKEEQTVLIKSFLTQLLILISSNENSEEKNENGNLPCDIMQYINQNITKDISVKKIANTFHISTPQLFRIFKSEFNTSIHKYILEKRLVIAHKMIGELTPASVVAKECGFNSYPNFYRQYKKMFGINPSNKKEK